MVRSASECQLINQMAGGYQMNSLEVDRCGVILNVERFDDCVAFYKSLFGLDELFSKVDGDFRLTCLEFGSAYLMIETGGIASDSEKTVSQSPTILRFNVPDARRAMETVLFYDHEAKLHDTDWGTIIRCTDPDGNPISIRESKGF